MADIDFRKLLFGFQGRTSRSKYWLAVVIYLVGWIVIGAIAWALSALAWVLGAIIALPLFAVTVVSGTAVGIKRLHDRDKSGWWLLFFYLAPAVLDGFGRGIGLGLLTSLLGFIISVWAFIELGCLRGTAGPNEYGPDPLTQYA